MPRQTQMRPVGPPAPNVGSFGAAEVNLQNPVYRAQTAVDVGENPFEYLQKILGTASAVTSAVLDNETAKIKGELSMIRMEEEKEREARQEERYKKAEAREARVEEERALRQEANVWGADRNAQIAAFRASNNRDGLVQLRGDLLEQQDEVKNSGNIYKFEEHSKLLKETDSTLSIVDNELDENNKKYESAAAEAASERASELVSGNAEALLVDDEVSEGIFSQNPKSWRNAIEDVIVKGVVEKDPEFLSVVMGKGSDTEKRAVNRVIDREVDRVYDQMFQRRMTQERNAESSRLMYAAVNTAREDPTKSFNELSDRFQNGNINTEAFRRGLALGAKSHISEGKTPQERSTRAMALLSEHADKPEVAAAAFTGLNRANAEIKAELDISRRDASMSSYGNLVELDPQGNEVGWRMQFDTQAELVDWFYKDKMGIEPKDANDPRYAGLQPMVADLLREFDQDDAKTAENIRVANASANRNPSIKKSVMANDGWAASPLKIALDTKSYLNMNQQEIDSLVIQETGYSNSAPPDELTRAVSSLGDDPRAFRVVNSFFAHFPPSNPVVSTQIASDSKLRDAWVKTVFYREVIQESQGDEEGAIRAANQRFSEFKGYQSEVASGLVSTETKKKTEEAVVKGLQAAYGKKAHETLPGDDRMLLMSLAEMHIATGGNAKNAVEFAQKVMTRDLGYTILSSNVNGQPTVDLVYNPPKRYDNGSTMRVLPENTGTLEWNRYLDDLKPIASEFIGSLPSNGRPTPEDTTVVSIRVSHDPIDIESGGCSVVATTKTGATYRVPLDRISVSQYNFQRWQKVNPEKPVTPMLNLQITP
jgi:hypothetical protein